MNGSYEVQRDNMTSLAIWPTLHNTCNPHFHSSIELTYVLDGEFRTIINGKTVTAKKDELVIFSSYCTHATPAEPKQHNKTIVMIIPPELIGAASGRMSGKIFRQTIVSDPAVCSEILHCMRMLIRLKKYGPLDSCVSKGYAYVVIGLLMERVGLTDTGNDKTDYFFKDILAYIEEHYMQPLSLETISTTFGYSKYSFSHLFNSYFGCTLTDYVNSLRARCASSLLTETELSMTEIAMRSGFESLRTFYRAFKKNYNCTPSVYKKRRESR